MCLRTTGTMDSSMECGSSNRSDNVLDETSGSNSFPPHSYDENDSDDCCLGKSGSSSLEDTLSLTCDDESLSSNLSSTFVADDDDDDSSDDCEDYPSPHLLRRRLMPLPPSPITNTTSTNSSLDTTGSTPVRYKAIPEVRAVSKRRHSTRIFSLMVTLSLYVIVVNLDHRWIFESARDFGISEEARQWRRFFRRRAPKILHKIPNKASGRFYTLRIKGRRLDLVTQSLDFHAHCPSVKEVQVEWSPDHPNNNHQLPKSLLQHKSGKVRPLGKASTMAIFLLAEDVRITCEEIERAFSEWRQDPSKLVGFYPFQHATENGDHASLFSTAATGYALRPVSTATGSYSMVSDRAVFVHNSILRSLPALPTGCQHLSMSVIVSAMTSKPPVVVLSNARTVRQNKRNTATIISNEQSRRCQQWVDMIGGFKLPTQVSTIVGHGKRRLQESDV